MCNVITQKYSHFVNVIQLHQEFLLVEKQCGNFSEKKNLSSLHRNVQVFPHSSCEQLPNNNPEKRWWITAQERNLEFLNVLSSVLTYKDYLIYSFKKESSLVNHLMSHGNAVKFNIPLALELTNMKVIYSSLPEFYLKKLVFLLSTYRCDEYKKVGV